jgi:hypothetical protein
VTEKSNRQELRATFLLNDSLFINRKNTPAKPKKTGSVAKLLSSDNAAIEKPDSVEPNPEKIVK